MESAVQGSGNVTQQDLLVQLAGKRWRFDIGARQEVSLQLSAVDLPGGAQVCIFTCFLWFLSAPSRLLHPAYYQQEMLTVGGWGRFRRYLGL